MATRNFFWVFVVLLVISLPQSFASVAVSFVGENDLSDSCRSTEYQFQITNLEPDSIFVFSDGESKDYSKKIEILPSSSKYYSINSGDCAARPSNLVIEKSRTNYLISLGSFVQLQGLPVSGEIGRRKSTVSDEVVQLILMGLLLVLLILIIFTMLGFLSRHIRRSGYHSENSRIMFQSGPKRELRESKALFREFNQQSCDHGLELAKLRRELDALRSSASITKQLVAAGESKYAQEARRHVARESDLLDKIASIEMERSQALKQAEFYGAEMRAAKNAKPRTVYIDKFVEKIVEKPEKPKQRSEEKKRSSDSWLWFLLLLLLLLLLGSLFLIPSFLPVSTLDYTVDYNSSSVEYVPSGSSVGYVSSNASKISNISSTTSSQVANLTNLSLQAASVYSFPTIVILNATDYLTLPCTPVRYSLMISSSTPEVFDLSFDSYLDTLRSSNTHLSVSKKPVLFSFSFLPSCNEYGNKTIDLIFHDSIGQKSVVPFDFFIEPNGIPIVPSLKIRAPSTKSVARVPVTNLGYDISNFTVSTEDLDWVSPMNRSLSVPASSTKQLSLLIEPQEKQPSGAYPVLLVLKNERGIEYVTALTVYIGVSSFQAFIEDHPLWVLFFLILILLVLLLLWWLLRWLLWKSKDWQRSREERRRERALADAVREEQRQRAEIGSAKMVFPAGTADDENARRKEEARFAKLRAAEERRERSEYERANHERSLLYDIVLDQFLKEHKLFPKNSYDQKTYLWYIFGTVLLIAILALALYIFLIPFLWAIIDGVVIASIMLISYYIYSRVRNSRILEKFAGEIPTTRNAVREDLRKRFIIIEKQHLVCGKRGLKRWILYFLLVFLLIGLVAVIVLLRASIAFWVWYVMILSLILFFMMLIGLFIAIRKHSHRHIIGDVSSGEDVRVQLPFRQGIGEMILHFKRSVYSVVLCVILHSKAPTFIEPLGVVYSYFEIRSNVEPVLVSIRFKVSKFWLKRNNVDPLTVRLARYNNGKWVVGASRIVSQDCDWIYYECDHLTNSFFAITGKSEPKQELIFESKPLPSKPVIQEPPKYVVSQKPESRVELKSDKSNLKKSEKRYDHDFDDLFVSVPKKRKPFLTQERKRWFRRFFLLLLLLLLLFLLSYCVYNYKDAIASYFVSSPQGPKPDSDLERIQNEIKNITNTSVQPVGQQNLTLVSDVSEAPANITSYIEGIPDLEVIPGNITYLDLNVYFSDPDGDPLEFTNNPKTSHVEINYTKGVASVTADKDCTEEKTAFIATDPGDLSAQSNNVTITCLRPSAFRSLSDISSNPADTIYAIAGLLVIAAVILLAIALLRFRKKEDTPPED